MPFPFSQQRSNDEQQPQQMLGGLRDQISVSNPNKDFARWHLGNDEMLEDLEHMLRGEIKRHGKWEASGHRLMNDDGIREVITIIYGHANKFVFLSKLKEDDIMDLMKHLDSALIDLLRQKFSDYEIELPDLDIIRSIIITICYSGMTRGLDGWTMEQTGTSMTSREVIMPNEQPNKKKFLGIF